MSALPERFRENAVRPEVPTDADILNVGFAPGRDEVEIGRPFVGPSGKLLRSWLGSAGLLGRSAFINVESHRTFDLVCRNCGVEYWLNQGKLAQALARAEPTKTQLKLLAKYPLAGDCDHDWRELHGNREPRDDECCGLPIIERLLATRPWKAVLCWGAVPARFVGGYKGSVGSMVGRFRSLPTGQSVTVLYHPAYLLRLKGSASYGTTEALIRDVLRQVADRVALPENAGTGIYPYIELTEQAVPRLAATGTIIDIETDKTDGNNGDPDPRTDIPNMLCVGTVGSSSVLLRSVTSRDSVRVEAGSRFLMHHAQYDMPLLARMCGHSDFTADDTMVMAYLDGEEILGLKPLARRRLRVHARDYLEKSGPDDREYDAQDVHLTRDLAEYYKPRLSAKGLDFLYNEVKVPLQQVMLKHVLTGLAVDHERVVELHDKMELRTRTLRSTLYSIAGREFNLGKTGTTDETTDLVYSYGIPEAPVRGQRGVTARSTGEVHIGQFRHIPFINTLLAYRRAAKFVERTEGLLPKTRVSGLYDLTGTGTDRVSQAHDNLMNMNALVKACIVADTGGYFVYGDYSQIELRLAAYFSRDSYLLGVLREGRNMHEELCLAVYGARTPEQYTQAKSSNFAKLFGAGLGRRARTLKMPVEVVKRNEIPWTEWDSWVAERKLHPAKTYFGYERNIDANIESSDEYLREKANRQIINSIIQGTAGETNQYAQVLCDRNLRELGGFVIHQEHDSVLGWVPDRISQQEGRDALLAGMMAAVPDEISQVIEIKAKVTSGSHWG